MEAVRINRYLAMCGLGSRRACEQMVAEGRVSVNGSPVTSLGFKVMPADRVLVDDEPAKPERELVVLLHKPRNVLCTKADPMGRGTIYDLLPHEFQSLAHVGRLDRESEGLLVLTNAGTLTYTLTHPSSKVEKEYMVEIDRSFDPRDRQRMLDGIQTEEGMAFATAVEMVKQRVLRIVLQQGIKRQIRLMLAELGYEVRQLVRTRIGSLEDAKLKPGKWRRLSSREIDLLQKNPGADKKSKAKGTALPPPPTVRSRRPAASTAAQGQRRSPDGIGPRPVAGKSSGAARPQARPAAGKTFKSARPAKLTGPRTGKPAGPSAKRSPAKRASAKRGSAKGKSPAGRSAPKRGPRR